MVSSIILIIILTILGYVGQIAVFPALGATTVGPNMIIAVMVPAALLLGPWAGMAIGFVGGLAIDLFTGWGLGVSTMMLTLSGFFVGLIKEQINAKNIVFAMSIAILCYAALDLWSAMVLYFSRMTVYFSLAHIWRMILSALLTAFFTMINHLLLRRSKDTTTRRSPYFS